MGCWNLRAFPTINRRSGADNPTPATKLGGRGFLLQSPGGQIDGSGPDSARAGDARLLSTRDARPHAVVRQREGLLPLGERTLDVFVARQSEQQNGESIRSPSARGRPAFASIAVSSRPPWDRSSGRRRRWARVAIILAPEESARGEAIVRDLHRGEQVTVALDDVE